MIPPPETAGIRNIQVILESMLRSRSRQCGVGGETICWYWYACTRICRIQTIKRWHFFYANHTGRNFPDRSKIYNAQLEYNFFTSFILLTSLPVCPAQLSPWFQGNIVSWWWSSHQREWIQCLYSVFKKWIGNRLNLSASFRDDKNSLFEKAKVTSRFSAVLSGNEHYIRASYQNAYSFPAIFNRSKYAQRI
jgi:hypothetical protein